MVPSNLTPKLEKAADCAINQSLMMAPSSAGEVDFVKAVVVDGVLLIGEAWAHILGPAGYSVRLTGVFCHLTPKVKFKNSSNKPKCCELADLLVVVDDVAPDGRVKRMAVLIQAKIAKKGGGKKLTTPGDLTQLDLYSNWHPFELPSAFPPPTPRNFANCRHAGTPTDCGQYGLIAKQPDRIWHQQPPIKNLLAGDTELGTFLARMVENRPNYGREATGRNDDWSQTVDDLMKVTGQKIFRYHNGAQQQVPRSQSVIAFFASDRFGSRGILSYGQQGIPPSGEIGPIDDDPDNGINYLHIRISKSEEEGRGRSG